MSGAPAEALAERPATRTRAQHRGERVAQLFFQPRRAGVRAASSLRNMRALQRQVRVHFFVDSAPAHVCFHVLRLWGRVLHVVDASATSISHWQAFHDAHCLLPTAI